MCVVILVRNKGLSQLDKHNMGNPGTKSGKGEVASTGGEGRVHDEHRVPRVVADQHQRHEGRGHEQDHEREGGILLRLAEV